MTTHTNNGIVIAEASMLWMGDHPDLRFRKPRTLVIRALRTMQKTGTKIVIVSRSSSCSARQLVSMLNAYGIYPAHIAFASVGEMKIKQALFYRHKPIAVYEDSLLVSAWYQSQNVLTFTPEYLDNIG